MTDSLKPLPIGVPTFRDLIQGGFLYIDKTQLIYELIRNPKGIYFLSRPRRFGKSLLISTLHEVFSGNRHLFHGLWLDSSAYSWDTHPIVHIDFSLLQVQDAQQLKHAIKTQLGWIADQHQIALPDDEYNIQFAELLLRLGQTKQVVVLIDEYDKPLIDHLDNLTVAKEIQEILKGFYIVLKGMDRYLRFVFLTGVSKFSKVGIFSGLNNLQDLSMDDRFGALPGITQDEMEHALQPYLQRVAQTNALDYDELLAQIRTWYNGFRFSKGAPTVYNPFSLVYFFDVQDFRNYWFESGTPSFLLQLFQTQEFDLTEINARRVGELAFSTYELDSLNLLPLLYQTGYLTIKSYDPHKRLYELYYPNYEVENAFQSYLLGTFTQVENGRADGYLWQLIEALQADDLDRFMETLRVFFAQIPYTIHIKQEKYYQTIFYLIFALIGLRVQAEVTTNRGRIDVVVELEDIYLFEFKLDGTEHAALQQIKKSKYYERFRNKKRRIHLVGVNFDSTQRSIAGWQSETINQSNTL